MLMDEKPCGKDFPSCTVFILLCGKLKNDEMFAKN